MSLKKDSGPKQRVADYLLSMHFGVCVGPVDKLRKILIGDKPIWEGSISTNSTISIDKPELFGGAKKEGGPRGLIDILLGGETQIVSSEMASRFGLANTDMPASRGFLSLFFRGSPPSGSGGFSLTGLTTELIIGTVTGVLAGVTSGPISAAFSSLSAMGITSSSAGFKWGSNTPYLKAPSVVATRYSVGLNTPKSIIQNTVTIADDPSTTNVNEASSFIVEDTNPADIIYEVLVNTDWGMGTPTSSIDTQSFLDAQATLFNENFGMSLLWTRQQKGEAFILEIISHINALFFMNPQTGLWKLKLIRNDYDESMLRHVDPDSVHVTDIQRRLWGETINEIVATWTNPANEKEETVTAQDLANISMQGGIVSDSRNYYGVRNGNLAMQLALRDVRTASSPLVTGEIVADRSFWKTLPGDCLKLSWPEDGIENLVVRVMKVGYGKPGDSKIKMSFIEDIFSNQIGAFTPPPKSLWVSSARDPVPVSNVKFSSIPFSLLELAIGANNAAAFDYPETATMVLAISPSADTYSFDLWAESPSPSGTLAYSNVAPLIPISGSFLPAALSFEENSTVAFDVLFGTEIPADSTLLIIGGANLSDDKCELAMVTSVGVSNYTIRRGISDTIPRAWPAGTLVWFFNLSSVIRDPISRIAETTTKYKLLTRTSLGVLPLTAAPVETYLANARPVLPLRPANVIVGGSNYADVSIPDTPLSVVHTTWANRNRFSESSPPMGWFGATTLPEIGQTTTIYVEALDGTIVATHAGITGTSFDVPMISFGVLSVARVRVTASRDGHESLQSHSIVVKIPSRNGYGYTYGKNYGGL